LLLIVVQVSAVSSLSANKKHDQWGRTVMPERAPARSIYILILLFLINLMNFFDRTIPAVVL